MSGVDFGNSKFGFLMIPGTLWGGGPNALEEGDAHVSFLFLPMRKAANVRDGWIKYEEQMMPRGKYKEKGGIT